MIYIYIYIYVRYPELGIILIRTNKIFKNRILSLNNSGQELNVNKIHRANNFLLNKTHNHIKIIDLFPDNKFIWQDGNELIILMWPIVVFLREKIYKCLYRSSQEL